MTEQLESGKHRRCNPRIKYDGEEVIFCLLFVDTIYIDQNKGRQEGMCSIEGEVRHDNRKIQADSWSKQHQIVFRRIKFGPSKASRGQNTMTCSL